MLAGGCRPAGPRGPKPGQAPPAPALCAAAVPRPPSAFASVLRLPPHAYMAASVPHLERPLPAAPLPPPTRRRRLPRRPRGHAGPHHKLHSAHRRRRRGLRPMRLARARRRARAPPRRPRGRRRLAWRRAWRAGLAASASWHCWRCGCAARSFQARGRRAPLPGIEAPEAAPGTGSARARAGRTAPQPALGPIGVFSIASSDIQLGTHCTGKFL